MRAGLKKSWCKINFLNKVGNLLHEEAKNAFWQTFTNFKFKIKWRKVFKKYEFFFIRLLYSTNCTTCNYTKMVMVICNCLNYFVILIYCIFFHKASRKQHVLQFAIEMEDLTLVKLLCDGGADVNILVLVHDYFVVSLLISKRDNISLKWLQYSYNMSIKCLIQA